MYTPKNFDIHHFCGQMDESIAFSDEQMGSQSPIYSNVVSFKKHNKNSEKEQGENSANDAVSLEEELINLAPNVYGQTFKCFKCFGTNQEVSMNGSTHICMECGGSQYISEKHPMASIFQKVLSLKLPYLVNQSNDSQNSRKSMFSFNYASQNSIQQQDSFHQEQLPPHCKNCNKECLQNSYRTCQICENYTVCNNCFNSRTFNHPYTHSFKMSIQNRKSKVFPSNPQNMKKISEQVESEQNSNYVDEIELRCHHCNEVIEECYEACLDCQKLGVQYVICAHCSQHNSFEHDPMHELGMKTLSQASNLLRLTSNKCSQCESIQPAVRSSLFKINTAPSVVKFNNIDLQSSEQNIGIHIQSQSSSPVKHLTFSRQFQSPLFQNKYNELQFQQSVFGDTYSPTPISNTDYTQYYSEVKRNNVKQTKNPEDSTISIDMQNSLDPQHDKGQKIRYSEVAPYSFSTNSQLKQTNKPLEEEYIFNDYQCDICGILPIKNIKYHCKLCQNYDICQICYLTLSKKHEHQIFQQTNGKQIQKKKKQLVQKMQQSSNKSIGRLSMTMRHSTIK